MSRITPSQRLVKSFEIWLPYTLGLKLEHLAKFHYLTERNLVEQILTEYLENFDFETIVKTNQERQALDEQWNQQTTPSKHQNSKKRKK